MKALLLKDFYTLIKQIRIFALMMVLFACIPGYSIFAYAMMYAAMLPVTALAYDERSKWDILAVMMPYSARSIVLSKYVLGYIAIAVASVFSTAVQIVANQVRGEAFKLEIIISIILISCAATVMQAINLPFMFKFGVEKGRLAFFAMIIIITVGGMAGGDKLVELLSASEPNIITVVLATVISTLFVNLISIPISTGIYKKRV